jgi:hypothetical protein
MHRIDVPTARAREVQVLGFEHQITHRYSETEPKRIAAHVKGYTALSSWCADVHLKWHAGRIGRLVALVVQ